MRIHCVVSVLLILLAVPAQELAAADGCRIEIVDKASGWPVPLVELRTVSGLRFVSDNAGVIACDAPELLGQETWFHVQGQGYGVEPDGFGYEGVRLTPRSSSTLRIEVDRRVIAKRIGRITGSGLYAESEKLGEQALVSDSGIVGCDSVQTALHRGKLHWLWGDSNLARYPLGIYHASSATSATQPLKSFEPPLDLPLEYFRDTTGQPRGVAKLPGRGPTWLFGLVSLDDASGDSHLVATYVKVDPPLSAWQRGLCEWNEATQEFEVKRVLWNKGDDTPEPKIPHGHTAFWDDDAGTRWVLFGNPLPVLKFPATYEAWSDPATWQSIDAPTHLTSAEGVKVKPHSGSVAWNGYRKRWVTIFMEAFGKPSGFGEIWYAEAESPFGPWGTAVKVLSHQNYSFYNPQLHPEFTTEDAPHLFFEGTYTTLFAGPSKGDALAPTYPQATPRYDYNQILYRLDLDEPALSPAMGSGS
ncbi:MAG: hypothetical protein KDB05_11560 [Planctomycetales bacterium]|nr:hypothetical protein [Planctomycetales bacterium]